MHIKKRLRNLSAPFFSPGAGSLRKDFVFPLQRRINWGLERERKRAARLPIKHRCGCKIYKLEVFESAHAGPSLSAGVYVKGGSISESAPAREGSFDLCQRDVTFVLSKSIGTAPACG